MDQRITGKEIERAFKRLHDAGSDKSKSGLAKEINVSPSAVTAIIKDERKVSARELPVILRYLEMDTVPVVGYVGASGIDQISYGEGDKPVEPPVPMPRGGTAETVAVRIRGTSFGLGYDGGLAYYDRRQDGMRPEWEGKPCVLWLDDGRVVLKVPRKAMRGRWHLFSNAVGEAIMDAKVMHAAKVLWTEPGNK